MKFQYHTVFIILFLISVQCARPKISHTDTHKPNVIIIFADDLGYSDLSCYGSKIQTPNIDKLASEGARLTHFYAAQPVCSASRAAILTGCYANRVGIHQALMPDAKIGLHPDETTIADMLKSNGYHTAIFGKWHLGDNPAFMPLAQGFDEFYGIPYSNDMWPYHPQQGSIFNFKPLPLYHNNTIIDTLDDQQSLTTQITEKSIQFIKQHSSSPFFLYVPHVQPHVPLFVSPKFKGKSGQGLYADVIMEIDWSVGQILKTLDDLHLRENTMVIFTSDNGPWLAYGNHAGSALPFREGKGTVWEGGVREPCIIRYPNIIKPGSTIAVPMMNIDILPTIASITKSKLPTKSMDGIDILPILKGKTKNSLHEAFYFYYGKNELQAIRYRDFKMYFPHTYITLQGQQQGKDGKPGMPKSIKMDKAELYNLNSDPSETNNIIDMYPDVVAKMNQLAIDFRKRLGDNLTNSQGSENRLPGTIQ